MLKARDRRVDVISKALARMSVQHRRHVLDAAQSLNELADDLQVS
jgi:hypothetical protein